MSKEQNQAETAKRPTTAELTEDDHAYARAVVHRQFSEVRGKTSDAEVDAKVAELAGEPLAELVACGREGLIGECHRILGLA